MKNPKEITANFFASALVSIGIGTSEAADTVSEIQKTRNEVVRKIEEVCSIAPDRNNCYTTELRTLFAKLMKDDPVVHSPSLEEQEDYKRDMDRRLSEYCNSRSECDLTKTQIILYSDVSEVRQSLSVWLMEWEVDGERVYNFIGASKISSGYPDSRPRKPATETKFLTGTGVYTTNPLFTGAIGYRAEGTKNKNGIRGLGEKWARVYDVGPMITKKPWNGEKAEIRFMLHSTDPVLESKFWSRASQGCLRIPKTINRFLEYSGALDAGYPTAIERSRWAVRTNALWLLGRNPIFSSVSGSLIVIGEWKDENSETQLSLNEKR